MLIPRRLFLTAAATLVASLAVLASAHAGENRGLCRNAPTNRVKIPTDFGVDACFDGSRLTLRNSISLVLKVSRSGDVGNPSRRESDYGLAADAERLKSSDPNIFLPGDELLFPIGLGAGTVGIRGSSDNGFYAIATTIADFFPGKPNAIVGAFTSFVSDVDSDFTQYHTCLVGKNWFAQLGCRTLLVRNVTFAAGRGAVSGGAKAAVGVILSGYTWSKWLSATVSDSGASFHQSGTIHIAAVPAPAPATTQPAPPPPTVTTQPAAPSATTIPLPPSTTPAAPQGGAPSCTAYEQMSDLQKEQTLQSMEAAHHDSTPLLITRGSVALFCHIYPDHAVDGVYDGRL